MCWTCRWDKNKSVITHQLIVQPEPSETFQRGSGRPFATLDVKKSIFWAAYSVPDVFNCKHKPFIFTVLQIDF